MNHQHLNQVAHRAASNVKNLARGLSSANIQYEPLLHLFDAQMEMIRMLADEVGRLRAEVDDLKKRKI